MNPYSQLLVMTLVSPYTQSQIDSYYQQYQCDPPQPYQIIPDYSASAYVRQQAYAQGQAHNQQLARPQGANTLAPPLDEEIIRKRRSKVR
jgi:hypothetical protein